LSRPIIARLHSESHDSDGITVLRDHQRLSQQNRHKADLQRRLLFCPLSARSGHAVTARGVSIVAIDPNQSRGAVMLLATAAWLAKAREKRKNACRFGVHSENLGYVYFLY